jgi:adenylate kinase family enzyme
MIYLIGGAPRGGKSTFAKLLSKKLKISLIETDLLTDIFQKNAPEYGLKYDSDYELRKLKFDPILKSLIKYFEENNEDQIIEGDMILVENLDQYLKISKNIRPIFFGFDTVDLKTKIQNCLDYPNYNDWFIELETNEQQNIIRGLIDWSKKIKEICIKNNINYVDTSNKFAQKIQDALDLY